MCQNPPRTLQLNAMFASRGVSGHGLNKAAVTVTRPGRTCGSQLARAMHSFGKTWRSRVSSILKMVDCRSSIEASGTRTISRRGQESRRPVSEWTMTNLCAGL